MAELSLKNSVPTPSPEPATSAKYKHDDEDDQQCGAIHGSLLRKMEPANLARLNYAARRDQLFFFPVTSSHFSPRSFLIASTFLDASSFIATKAARAAV